MANTITNVVVNYTAKEAIVYLTLASDGTNETNTVVYDSSAVATLIQNIKVEFTDPLKSRILEIYASASSGNQTSSSGTSANGSRVKLLWDAATKVLALDVPTGTNPTKANFRKFGGLVNQGGSGITGDILLTTTGLLSGDLITIVLTVGAY